MVSLFLRSALIIAAITISLVNVQSASPNRKKDSNNIDVGGNTSNSTSNETSKLIFVPFPLLRKVYHFTTTKDVVDNFVRNDTALKTHYRKNPPSNIANTAVCIPRSTNVSLELKPSDISTNTAILYYPKSTTVKRCGGCCAKNNNLMSCQPVKNETLHFKILELEYENKSDHLLTFKGFKNASVVQHLACKCDCIQKKEDCNNKTQEYIATQCLCKCKENYKKKVDCENIKGSWNETTCVCEPLKTVPCTIGSAYNETTMQCTKDTPVINCPNSGEEAKKCEEQNHYWNSTACLCEKAESTTKQGSLFDSIPMINLGD